MRNHVHRDRLIGRLAEHDVRGVVVGDADGGGIGCADGVGSVGGDGEPDPFGRFE